MRIAERRVGWLTVALLFSSTTLGCELIAKPDRSKIQTGETSVTTTQGSGGGTTSSGTGGHASTGGSGGQGTGGHATGGNGGHATGGAGGHATGGAGGQGTGGVGGHGGVGGQGAGGSGGTGGGTPCGSPNDCPGADTECGQRTCESGTCGVSNKAAGTPLAQQKQGDCQTAVCDGNGATTTADDDTDLPDDANPCTTDTCSQGQPGHAPVAAGPTPGGVSCANGFSLCDGSGACVECLAQGDCGPGDLCVANACVAATCNDQQKDGQETATDCGGPKCSPCADGLGCKVASDCTSGVCGQDGLCAKATCNDGVQNGDETAKDCGGATCPKCGPLLGCSVDGDCVGGSCVKAVCAPTCSDGVKNGNETAKDCGGGTCAPCADGLACKVGSDCVDGVCGANSLCSTPTCNDGVKNGSETAKDCGGVTCGPCADGLACKANADCQSQICTAGACAVPSCNDGVKNGSETGVDCGGASCALCPTVVMIGAGSGSSFGAEYSPGGAWVPTSIGGASTDGLALSIVGNKGVGLARFTSDGDKLEYVTWTPGAWSAWKQVGGNTTRGRPAIDGTGTTAQAIFHGSDFKYYYEAYDAAAGTWGNVETVGNPQTSGATPAWLSVVSGNANVVFQDGTSSNVFKALARTNGTWGSVTPIDGNQNFKLSPTVVALSGTQDLLAISIVDATGQLLAFTRDKATGAWSASTAITNAFTNAQVALSPMPNGGAMLAFRGTDGNLYYAVYSTGAWGNVTAFSNPNVAIAAPPALAHGVGTATAEIAFVKADNHAYHARYVANAWTAPVDVGATNVANVAIASAP
jgi:hypothetical protein